MSYAWLAGMILAQSGRLLYESDEGGGQVVRHTLGETPSVVALVGADPSAHLAIWAPNGRSYAFISGLVGASAVFVSPAEEAPPIAMCWVAEGWIRALAWAPEGARVAYEWQAGLPGAGGVDILDIARRRVTRVTGSGAWDGQPAWSPDGRWLVVVHAETQSAVWEPGGVRMMRPCDLYVVESMTLARRRITRLRGDLRGPSWAPDRRTIFFVQGAPEGEMIRAVDQATGEVRTVRTEAAGRVISRLRLSPDGDSLAYVATAGETNDVCVVAATGGEPTVLATAAKAADIAWDPTSAWVAAVVDGKLALLKADGSGRQDLEATPRDPTGLSWAP